MLFRGSAEVRCSFVRHLWQAAECNFQPLEKLQKKLFDPASDHTRNGNWNCWFYLYHSVAACKLSICNFLCIYRLIIGGIPAILRSLKDGWQSEEKKSLLVNILVFLILLAVAMAMVFLMVTAKAALHWLQVRYDREDLLHGNHRKCNYGNPRCQRFFWCLWFSDITSVLSIL